MEFEYNPEKLIAEVKKRPGIWDFDHQDYRSKEIRNQLWSEVVNELLPDAKVSKSERRELILQLQKKWKNFRDCFQKYVHNPKRTRRPYIYAKQMQFILKDYDETQTDQEDDLQNSPSDEDFAKKARRKGWKSRKTVKLSKDYESLDEDANIDAAETDNSYEEDEPSVKVHKIDNKSHLAEEFAFANVDTTMEADDADKMFLLSLLPHLKSVPEEHRIKIKISLMQVFQNDHDFKK